MDLFEYQGKQYFARYGIPVSPGGLAVTPDEAVELAERVGYPVVVKAQVQVGGRGKAGGIKLAANADEAHAYASSILGMDIKGHTVRRLWVEHASDIAREYYASFTLDRGAKAHLAMVSAKGGVEIEQVAAEDPDAIARLHVDPFYGFDEGMAQRLVDEAGIDEEAKQGTVEVLSQLYRCFVDGDADLVEVNPLILTPDGRVHALDAKVTLDDNAAFRHPEWEEFAAHRGTGRAGASRPRIRLAICRPRRLHRDNCQRRRVGHEHLRRREPGRRPAGQFPGHWGRGQRRGNG